MKPWWVPLVLLQTGKLFWFQELGLVGAEYLRSMSQTQLHFLLEMQCGSSHSSMTPTWALWLENRKY
ncbi:MAG: hypothetical protein A3E00_16630 [Curvibacter sp. RIFCSPHIGHO2_12_FULL_63_18]|nr:MAG: hypothetical protein A2037_09175 [Curvibacter sp. GWA2_63_95]OGO98498.1 MAG: hypothetical protein A3E00_16630 [Curvibacter sp. RIFCSPHIGHO2_12_FULL_63_18]